MCGIIKAIAVCVHLFKKKEWDKAIEFEENPLTMGFMDLLYFSYKYYYLPPRLPSHPRVLEHFQKTNHHIPEFQTQLSISLGGDLMPYEMIKPENTLHLWNSIGKDFFGSDIVFANLETPLDKTQKTSFVPEVMLSNMLFNTNETTFNIFNGNGQFKGFDILSIANNHSLDMGKTGLINTIEFLESKNIKAIGGARTQKEAEEPVIIEKNGFKIGFIAYTYSLNQFEPPKDQPWLVNVLPLNLPNSNITLIQKQSKACRAAGADLVLCSIHAGNAYQTYPGKTTVDLFENIFKTCGVDIIIGGHPHNLQPWRHYTFNDPETGQIKNGFAIYSLADFIAYDIFTWCHLCAYVKLEIGRNQEGKVIFKPTVNPLIMQRDTKQLKLEEAAKVFEKEILTEEEQDLKILYDACIN